MTRYRRAALPAVVPAAVVIAATGLVACSDDSSDEIDRAAGELATALETGDTTGLWPETDLGKSLTNLADLPRQVTVTEVGEPEAGDADSAGSAVVALEWAWDLDEDGAPDWTYATEARLTEDTDGSWAAAYDPGILVEGLDGGATVRLTRQAGERGEVLARDGSPIVTDRPVRRVGIDKTKFAEGATDAEIEEGAVALAELIGFDDPAAYAERVLATGPRAFVEAITVREGSSEVPIEELDDIPGAVALPDELPLAPTTTWSRPLLGRAGEATAEVIEESDGAIGPGDVVGLSGLQRTYDAHLRGTAGLAVVLDQAGDSRQVFEREPVDGADLQLSLDIAAQTAAEDVIGDVEEVAGLVALRPSTGEVLAVANSAGTEGQNVAMLATLAPGSSFKVVTALALLRAGVGPDDVVSCTPEATVSGYSIANYPGYPSSYIGDITMTDAIAQSCNSALINARDQLTAQDLADAAASLGMGQQLPADWAGFTGEVPTEMTETELAASLIGQGNVLASPLSMATVAGSVRSGEMVTPRLVVGPEGIVDAEQGEQGDAPAQPLTDEEAEVLTGYLRAVVEEGTGILLSDLPGEPVHAKTGSAEVGEGDSYRVDSWMIAHQGDLAVAALVHGGGHGSGAAGTAVEQFLRGINR